MDITQKTEICALKLKNAGYFQKAERSCRGVSMTTVKNIKQKHQNNSTIGEKKGIKKEEAIKRIEEHTGNSNLIDSDLTTTY